MTDPSAYNPDERLEHEERLRLFYAQWGYCYGVLMPKWIEDLVGFRALEVYYHRYRGRQTNLGLIPCAIELERRTTLIGTVDELMAALARVSSADYDFSAAIALEQEVEREREALGQESDAREARWEAERPRRNADATPDGRRLLLELEAKQLPSGAVKNLEIIRAIVGIDKKATAES